MIVRTTRRAARQAVRGAFTLMEMLVVVAIIVILAGGGTFYYMKYLDEAKINKAKIQIKSIETAVEAYKTNPNHDEYPANLMVLTQRDADGGRPALDVDALKTPWGKQYGYDPAGPRNGGNKADIWADAPNGKVIGNWPGGS
jgi:general secretion pathway protein G